MRNMHLPATLPSGDSWAEELPDGCIEQSTGSFGYDYGSKVLNIKIMGDQGGKNLQAAIQYIVGYSQAVNITNEVSPSGINYFGRPFSPTANYQQGPYRLSRNPPAKHPQFQGLYATKILSVAGRGINRLGANRWSYGTDGNYEYTYISILFEIPKYPIMPDDLFMTGIDKKALPEYYRYCTWEYTENFETITRRGVTWTAPFASNQQATFAGDRILRVPKGSLKITWHDVDENFIKLGKLLPYNFTSRNSTLNARPFPFATSPINPNAYTFFDQNKAQFPVQYGPGTLLLIPSKQETRTQNHPAVLNGSVDPMYFPRTVDVTITMLHFDPPTNDPTTIDLSGTDLLGRSYGALGGLSLDPEYEIGVNYVVGSQVQLAGVTYKAIANNIGIVPPNAAFWTVVPVPEAATPIRGHNLAPLIRPNAQGYIWVSWVNDITSAAVIPLIIPGLVLRQYFFSQTPGIFNANNIPSTTAVVYNGIYYSYIGPDQQSAWAFPVNPGLWKQGVKYDTSLLYPYSDFEALFEAVNSVGM